MRRRSRIGSHSFTLSPSTKTSPDVGSTNRLISFNVVVFPEPLRPRSTSVSPDSTLNERFSRSVRPLIANAASRNSTTVVIEGSLSPHERCASRYYNRGVLSWIEIDVARLRNNIDAFRTVTAPGTAVMVVVKANAYGHGLEVVA